jgi:hypothetical protein
MDKNS